MMFPLFVTFSTAFPRVLPFLNSNTVVVNETTRGCLAVDVLNVDLHPICHQLTY